MNAINSLKASPFSNVCRQKFAAGYSFALLASDIVLPVPSTLASTACGLLLGPIVGFFVSFAAMSVRVPPGQRVIRSDRPSALCGSSKRTTRRSPSPLRAGTCASPVVRAVRSRSTCTLVVHAVGYLSLRLIVNKVSIRFFNDREIRAVWDDAAAKWWFSVLDVVGTLNGEPDYAKTRNYWKYLKAKLKRCVN